MQQNISEPERTTYNNLPKAHSSNPTVENSTRKVSGRKSIATPSIFGLLKGEAPDGNLNEPTSHPILNGNQELQKENFTAEELLKVWKQFVANVDLPQLKSALDSREPILKEDWQIEYLLDNDLQLQRITIELKPKLIGFLHRNLKNEMIEIDFKVSVNTEEIAHKPYTDEEKWKLLTEKHPDLSLLKTKFNLDFEHL